jgi:hypothetical protein
MQSIQIQPLLSLTSLNHSGRSAGNVPALDLMRAMIRALPVNGYEIIKADHK